MERIRERRPAQPLILALDNDERGQKASAELEDALRAENVPYFVFNPCGDAKDANEALQTAPEAFLRRVEDGERLPEMEKAFLPANERTGAFSRLYRRHCKKRRYAVPADGL